MNNIQEDQLEHGREEVILLCLRISEAIKIKPNFDKLPGISEGPRLDEVSVEPVLLCHVEHCTQV